MSKDPRFARPDYTTHHTRPVFDVNEGGQTWYYGTGIAPAQHPLCDRINFYSQCEQCSSTDLLVVAAQWNVHIWTGDTYSDFEMHCQSCGEFLVGGHADN